MRRALELRAQGAEARQAVYRHASHVAQLGHVVGEVFGDVDDVVGPVGHVAAVFGKLDPLGGPRDQGDAQDRLERADVPAQARVREGELQGRPRERAGARDDGELCQVVVREHAPASSHVRVVPG